MSESKASHIRATGLLFLCGYFSGFVGEDTVVVVDVVVSIFLLFC